MTIEHWLEAACADADRRGLPDLKPTLHALAAASAALRAAAWNEDAAHDPAPTTPACPAAPHAGPHGGTVGPRPFADRPPEPRASQVPLHRRSITELAPLIASRAVSSEALTRACLDEIDTRNAGLHAFITVTADTALAQARGLDAEAAAGRIRGPLHGIPLSLKDLIDQAGVPTTAASRVRDGHVAGADAPVTTRLRDAGAVFIGKTNLHEFAFGTTSDDTAYGAVRHPVDPTRSPGGSSGGSAVGIVTGMSVASIGTDTGGSIRIPPAACGIVGLKPTWGEIPTDGVVPLSRSLDHVGPLARSVADAWLLYLVLRGSPAASVWTLPRRREAAGLALGIPRSYFLDVLDDDVRRRFHEAMDRLQHAGARIIDVAIPNATVASAIYAHCSLPEAAAYHAAAVMAHPDRYTPNVRLRVESGRYLLSEDYVRAERGRQALRADVDAALSACDMLALPALPIPAPPIGALGIEVAGREESVRAMMLRLTQVFNLTGHPAVVLPCGSNDAGLPCGVQFVGRRGETETLLAGAHACEAHVSAQ